MTIEGFRGPEAVLLSYDVSGKARSTAARVCQIVFGRSRTGKDGVSRQELGFVHRPGVIWVGQSVFLLHQRDADELAVRLRRLASVWPSAGSPFPKGPSRPSDDPADRGITC